MGFHFKEKNVKKLPKERRVTWVDDMLYVFPVPGRAACGGGASRPGIGSMCAFAADGLVVDGYYCGSAILLPQG